MIWLLLLVPFALWGLADMYVCYRFVRKDGIDSTAGTLWYWTSKWSFASQTVHFVRAFPYVAKDLTEALNIRPDDGEIT